MRVVHWDCPGSVSDSFHTKEQQVLLIAAAYGERFRILSEQLPFKKAWLLYVATD